MDRGRASSTTGVGATDGDGWFRDSGGVEVRFLLTPSTRAARAGSFLFLSIASKFALASYPATVMDEVETRHG
jgi:hypothetical protein